MTGIGTIETVINGDTLAGGVRANPTRIYELKAGNIIYHDLAHPLRWWKGFNFNAYNCRSGR